MASIQQEILQGFYRKLAEADGFSEQRVEQICDLFSGDRKPKAAEIVKILSEEPEQKLS